MDKMYHRIQMARTAQFAGAFAVAAVFFMPFVMPCILASVAILLAIFSKGPDPRMSTRAKKACLYAGIALMSTLLMTVATMRHLSVILNDPVQRRELDEMLSLYYGYHLEDVLAPLRSLFGR